MPPPPPQKPKPGTSRQPPAPTFQIDAKIAEELTQEQIELFMETFLFFDKEHKGIIPVAMLGTVMRSLMQYPTEHELKDLIAEFDPNNSGNIDLNSFLFLMIKKLSEVTTAEDIVAAFRVLDVEEKGTIAREQLFYFMTELGEKLDFEEAEEMVQKADFMGTGEIDYEKFVYLMNRPPKKKKKGKKKK